MARLTEDMTRLRGEIDALRGTRDDNEAKRMQEAHDAHEQRIAEIEERKRDVKETLAGFRSDHAEMAAELRRTLDDNEAKRMPEAHDAHEQRIAEIEERKRDVKETLAGFRDDVVGAHKAWFGPGPTTS